MASNARSVARTAINDRIARTGHAAPIRAEPRASDPIATSSAPR